MATDAAMTDDKLAGIEDDKIAEVEGEFVKIAGQAKTNPDMQSLLDAYWSNEIKLAIEKGKVQIAIRSKKARLSLLAGIIEQMQHAETQQQIDAICEKAAKLKEDWNNGKLLGNEETLNFAELEKEIQSAKDRVTDATVAGELADAYSNQRANGDLCAMATEIAKVRIGGKERTSAKQEALRSQFKQEWEAKLQADVKNLVASQQYEKAAKLLTDTCSSGDVKAIVTEEEAAIVAAKKADLISTPQAQQLWIAIKEAPEDAPAHETFLAATRDFNNGRLLKLKGIVKERIRILRTKTEKMTMFLAVDKVTFAPSPSGLSDYAGKTFHGSFVRFDNDTPGPTLLDTREVPIAYGQAITPQKDSETAFEMTRDESLKFRVKVRSEECRNQQLTALEPSNVFTYSLRDLADGVQFALTPLDSGKPQISVTLTLRGWEALPPLPDFSN